MFGWSYPAGCNGTPYDEFLPEECPICGKANWDEVTETTIHPSGVFCSDECQTTHEADLKACDDAAFQAWVEAEEYELMLQDSREYQLTEKGA